MNCLNSTVLCCLFAIVSYELADADVCKFSYKGRPEDFMDSIMYVPDNMVAMSETLYVGTPYQVNADTITTPTIFFIIDNSGSMVVGDEATDKKGNRFRVTHDLIDSLYRQFPKAEVGLSIFMEHLYFYGPDDPDYFTVLPNQWTNGTPPQPLGAYIPLFILDKVYGPKNLKGYEILQKYLETWDRIDQNGNLIYTDLEYDPDYDNWSRYMSASTNINAGFDCAKHAMLKSKYPPSHQFVVFLSDGEANIPQGEECNKYVEGKGVPTTFTVFFTKDSLPPGNLMTMTQNIKINKYSSTNYASEIWGFHNTSYDSLMNFLFTNIISKITSLIGGKPLTITINNTVIGNNWNNQAFTFTKMFPLLGWETPFKYDIFYHVKKDSVNDTGGFITTEYDTTITVKFKVKLDTTVDSLPKKFVTRCWDRTLGFYYNTALITSAYENMGTLEARFQEFMIDILYGYTNVSLELTNSNRSDKETLVLNNQGAYLSNTFKIKGLDAGQSPVLGNGTLELNFVDSIIAIFRNKDLPLDTVYTAITFVKDNKILIKSADYYDEQLGDGLIDSIFISYESDKVLTGDQIKEIVGQMALPAWRKLSIVSHAFTQNSISLTVIQDQSATAVTFVTDQDSLRISEKVLTGGGILFKGTLPIGDKIPPLIEAAHLVDYWDVAKNDLLTVAFSEKTGKIGHREPFFLKSMPGGVVYYATVNAQSSTDSVMVFTVASITGVSGSVTAMMAGDSIWISTKDSLVGDMLNNRQDHPNNRRRVLTVEREPVPFTLLSAAYYDEKNGDGLIDSMAIVFDCSVDITQDNLKDIVGQIVLPAWRKIAILSYSFSGKTISLRVAQAAGTRPVTFVTAEDTLQVKEKLLVGISWNISIAGQTIPIGDKIPPLIEKASLVDYMDGTKGDTLTVTFSENILSINNIRPFYFRSMKYNRAVYYAELTPAAHAASQMSFKVTLIKGVGQQVDYIISGDSIWISTDGQIVFDDKNNLQDHPDNRRAIVTVKRIFAPFHLIAKGVTPINLPQFQRKEGPKIPDIIIDKLDSKNKQTTIGNNRCGMLLQVGPEEPDKIFAPEFLLDGTLTIFDGVGNRIIAEQILGYDSNKKSLFYVWDCRNSNGRYVGPGTYLVVFNVSAKMGPELTPVKGQNSLKLFIGVEQSK